MSDIDGVSDRTPVIAKKMYDRALPAGGVQIINGLDADHNHLYLDFNDAPRDLVTSIRGIYEGDPVMVDASALIKGTAIGRKYRIYVVKGSKILGAFSYTEFLDSPVGYGTGDFYHESYVLAEFRKTNDHRLATLTIFHLLFLSALIKRGYSILQISPNVVTHPLDAIDIVNNPCTVSSFNPLSAQYMKIGQTVDLPNHLALLELDGNLYAAMDLPAYFVGLGKDITAVTNWLAEMGAVSATMKGISP